MNAEPKNRPAANPGKGAAMPVLFVGHGSPMNALEDNEFSREWRTIGKRLPRPKSILCVSAHWETWGTLVTAMPRPRTIHDFGGFPRPLYDVQYPAPGSPALAEETKAAVKSAEIGFDRDRGLDHGCWSVLSRMFPEAEIPVVQLSLDSAKSASAHYALAGELAPLRRNGVLIIGSGNIVHNLQRIAFRGGRSRDFNEPFGLDWAIEAAAVIKNRIDANDHRALIEYEALGRAVRLAVPTPEHYLPLLYALALKGQGERIEYFNDKPVAGSLTMTSLRIGSAD